MVSTLVTLLAVCGVLIYRNTLILKWRLRANHSWSVYAHKYINHAAESLKHIEVTGDVKYIFTELLEERNKFSDMFISMPSYDTMLLLRPFSWTYESLYGDYELKLTQLYQELYDKVLEKAPKG